MEYYELCHRLDWVKEKLELTSQEIADRTNIPRQSIDKLIKGHRTGQYERLEYLALTLNTFWQKRFKVNFPKFDGDPVEKITFLWLTLGEDFLTTRAKKRIQEIEIYYQEKMNELHEQIGALRGRK